MAGTGVGVADAGAVLRVGGEDAAGDFGGLAEVVGRIEQLLQPGVGEQLRRDGCAEQPPVGGRLVRGRDPERLVHDGLQPLLAVRAVPALRGAGQERCDGGRDGLAEQQRAGKVQVAPHGLGEDLQAFGEFAELRGGAEAEAEELAEGRPFAVPGAVGAFVVEVGGGQVQLGGLAGRLQGCAADQHGQHRVLLLRHGRGPAPAGGAGFGELGDLRPAEEQHVGGDLARSVGHGGQGVAEGCHGQPVGVPGRRDGGEAEFRGQPVGEIQGR